MSGSKDHIRKVLTLCKSHGILHQTSQHHRNAVAGCYDYGPLGSDLKRNIENEWWQSVVSTKENMFGVECSGISHQSADDQENGDQRVHVPKYNVAAKESANNVIEHGSRLPDHWLLQSTFSNSACRHYPNVLQLLGRKLPFGIAHIGKCFRSVDVADGAKVIYRMPEFTEMAVSFFTPPKACNQWLHSWQKERLHWWRKFSGTPSLFSMAVQEDANAADILFQFPWGVEVIERIANRGSDLLEEMFKDTKKNIQGKFKRRLVTPNLIEMVAGLDAGLFAYVVEAFQQKQIEDANGKSVARKVLRLHPRLAPIKVAIIPSKVEREIEEVAEYLSKEFRRTGIKVFHIGETPLSLERELFRFDEMGIPFTVIVDEETLKTGITEIRHRDTTMKQQVHITQVKEILQKHLDA